MRKAPVRLAYLFLAITIARVALFVAVGLKIGWMGWSFAIGLAVGVYVSAYFVRFKETKLAAGALLFLFLAGDLFFNEFELVRVLSAGQLVPPESDFLGMGPEVLTKAMQVAALFFGAFPTFAAAGLGWLQSGAERVQVLKSRAWFGKVGLALAARIESALPEIEDKARGNSQQPTAILLEDGNRQDGNRKVRWETLSAPQRAEIAGKPDGWIMATYGGSQRRARMWRQWAKEGK